MKIRLTTKCNIGDFVTCEVNGRRFEGRVNAIEVGASAYCRWEPGATYKLGVGYTISVTSDSGRRYNRYVGESHILSARRY